MKKDLNLGPFNREWCPEPLLEESPGLIDLYWRAWELAWAHVKGCDDAPQSPFMDEAFSQRTIWIWDTCFMVHFCKYAPQKFPGVQSFENFYQPMHDGRRMSIRIHHPDNPPLFAWIEHEYYMFTGDSSRLARIVRDKSYLQRHFDFIEKAEPGKVYEEYANCPLAAKREPLGYRWGGVQSGMDNTPRGRDDYGSIYWVDLLAQQALAAGNISSIARLIGENATAEKFGAIHSGLKELLNRHYWDEDDGIYYDIRAEAPHGKVKVKTPASYWPMLAGACDARQAARMHGHAESPKSFGGERPWPSVSPDDPAYTPEGNYWRGSIWLPTAYMATKALEKYGYHETADRLALNLLKHMKRTHDEFEPHTIWECYSSEFPRGGTTKNNERISRPDFCGWSAIGPVSMLIENVLGFHKADAVNRTLQWRKYRQGRHGIRRLRFGEIVTDLIADGDKVSVSSNGAYSLFINGERVEVKAGSQSFTA